MGSTNYGTQEITFRYNQPLISSDLNKWFYGIIKAGIYNGGFLSISSGNNILVAPMNVVVETSALQALHVTTADNVALTLAEATPYVTCQYTWVDAINNYMDFTVKAVGDLLSTDIIIGKGVYVGGTLDSFDYSEKTITIHDRVESLENILEKRLPAGVILPNAFNADPVLMGYRILPLQGAVLDISDLEYAELVQNVYCGDASNATAPAFYKTSDAGGTTRSTAGTYMVMPDTRAVSLKGVGNQTINTRVKTGPVSVGEVQEDQLQGHWHIPGSPATQVWGSGSGIGAYALPAGTGASPVVIADPSADTTNGTPRTGTQTQDCTIGTNFGITY